MAKNDGILVNEEIKTKEVRLVTDTSSDVISTKEALGKAEEAGLDLICVSMNGNIPVVKILDYSKYLYELKKKEKEAKKKSKATQVETKEIRIGDSIEINDLKTKAKMIDKFLTSKNKVKLTIRYKGRAIAHINEGAKKLENLTDLVTVEFAIENPAKIFGNTVSMTIMPK